MTDAKEYTEEEIRDSFNSGHTCGMEQGEELGRKQTIDRVLEIIDEVRSDANKGYMFDMVDEIKNRVLALKGEQE